MDRKDAEFLIDQFNKYASWAISQPLQHVYSSLALVVACAGVLLPLFVAYLHVLPTPSGMAEIAVRVGLPLMLVIAVALTTIGIFLRRVVRLTDKVVQAHERNIERLKALMNYLAKHSSLPSNLTFENLLEPEEKWRDRLM